MFCARLFICASWSPAGKGLTSWLSFVVSFVSLSLSHWYPGSGVVLDCIDSWSLQPYLLYLQFWYVVLEKRVSGIYLHLLIKALTCTYVLAGLAHFTYSASIVWNRKTQRSLVRGRSIYIHISIRDYIYSVYNQKHCLFFIHSTVFLFVDRDGIYVPPSNWLHPIWIYFLCYDLKEFAFSHDKATSSLK